MKNLIKILSDRLKDGLTSSEKLLLEKIVKNEIADFSSGDEKNDTPDNAQNWGDERTIRADLIYWLLVDKVVLERIHAKWIQVVGAKITGNLDFRSTTLLRPLFLINNATEDIILIDAQLPMINLTGSFIKSLQGDKLTTKGDVFLDNIKAEGEVRLLGANIGGNLRCNGAFFEMLKVMPFPQTVLLPKKIFFW